MFRSTRAVICLLMAMAALLCSAAAADVRGNLEGFDDFMAAAMKEFKVPGAAVAVVKDGKIILSKGYGYRDVAQRLPVTGATLFPIASITNRRWWSTHPARRPSCCAKSEIRLRQQALRKEEAGIIGRAHRKAV